MKRLDSRKINMIMLLLCTLLIAACSSKEATGQVQATIVVPISSAVIAEGQVVPQSETTLAFESGGTLGAVNAVEGEWVKAGDKLAELGDTSQWTAEQAALALELLSAQQTLDDLYQNEDVTREKSWQTVLEAQTAFNAAQKAFDSLDEDRYADDLEQAQEAIIDAKLAMEDASDELAEYEDLAADNATRKRFEEALNRAEDTYLEKVRAKSDLQTGYEKVANDLKLAESALELAQSDYKKCQNGLHTDRLALAQAQIDSIQAHEQAVAAQLAKMNLLAPFAGQVVKLYFQAGEVVGPGQPLLVLADTSTWVVESTDLTEMEVVKIKLGQTVQVEAEAFPGQIFSGTVEDISQYPQLKLGDVVYTVRIVIDQADLPELRWGMSVTITFDE